MSYLIVKVVLSMDKFCVYKHTSPSGKVYIGITSQKPESRWGTGGCGYEGNRHFWNAIQKYGWDNFQHEILYEKLSKETAVCLESSLIHEYHATDVRFGYNNISGPFFPDVSEELRETRRMHMKLRWTDAAYRKHMSDILPEACKGPRHTPESRELLRQHRLTRNKLLGKSVWVRKDDREKLIPQSDVDAYMRDGWVLGRVPRKLVYLHKEGQRDIKVQPEAVSEYLTAGWSLGRGSAVAANISNARKKFIWYYDDLSFTDSGALTEYLKSHGYSEIVTSTVTALANGQKFRAYQSLEQRIRKVKK